MALALFACVDTQASAGECGTCHVDATCGTDGAGKPLCVCKTGFTGDGKSCVSDTVDPGECGGCDPDAKCVKRGGAARCVCNHGFWGDGRSCTETSSCDDHNGSCHAFARCDEAGSISCVCEHGFAGDGWECVVPANGYVRLVGRIEVCVTSPGAACAPNSEKYAWEMSVPLTSKDGAPYSGSASTDVFEAGGTVTIEDIYAGQFKALISATTFNVTRSKEFHFSTNADDLSSPEQIDAEALPLTVFGQPQDWYFAGPPGMDYTLSGEMTAVFQQ